MPLDESVRVPLQDAVNRLNALGPRPGPVELVRLEREMRDLRATCRTYRERVAVDGMLGLVMLDSYDSGGEPGHLEDSIMLLNRLLNSRFTEFHQRGFAAALGRALDRRWSSDPTDADLRGRIELWRVLYEEDGDTRSGEHLALALQDRFFASDDDAHLDEVIALRQRVGAPSEAFASLTDKLVRLRERRRGGSSPTAPDSSRLPHHRRDTALGPLFAAASARSTGPMQSGALLFSVIEHAQDVEWQRLALEAPLLDTPMLASVADDTQTESTWRGLTVSEPLRRTLQLASEIADEYDLDPFEPGTLLLAVLLNGSCGVTASLVGSGSSIDRLVELVQQDLLGTELVGVAAVAHGVLELADDDG